MGKYIKVFDEHSQYETFRDGEDYLIPNVSYCIQEDEVHYNYIDPFNGHEYVDLGLPSGTLWATMNVGANSSTDYGLYFAWGETEGYTASQVGTDKDFTWDDYKYGSSRPFTKYNQDGLTNLELIDDVARVNWGGDWHMPNKAQCIELFNTEYVTNTWVTNYNGSGVNGRLFTSVSNGNTMFIPAAGYCDGGEVFDVGNNGSVWTSTLGSEEDIIYAWGFYLNINSEAGVNYGFFRYYGQSVRGVVGNLIYIERINNGVSQNSDIVWNGDSTTISVTLSDVVTADNVQISMSQSSYNGVATATSVDGKTWTATINTKSGWSNYHGTTVRIWSDSFDYSTEIPANMSV